MRVVLQRVSQAELKIDGRSHSNISKGLLILLGIEGEDNLEDINYLTRKIIQMRVFSDDQGKMNLSLLDIKGDLMLVSQFTLLASTKKGNRPSFIKSAKPEIAKALYEKCLETFEKALIGHKVASGVFGADMQINLINDGPVTILLDSKNKE